MPDVRNATIGDVVDRASRYRPFLLTLAGILVVVLILPMRERAGESDPQNARSLPTGTATSTGVAGGDQTSLDDDAAPGAAGTVSGATSRVRTGTQAASVPGRAAIPPAVSLSGADPLAAPDCDRSTGRIKVPTSWILSAPNCVPLWPKGADNGGRTWNGVTKDTITIAIYVAQENEQAGAILNSAGVEDDTSDEEDDANRQKVVEAYEAHFETYGRKVKWVKVEGSGAPTDDQAAKADAVRVATEVKAFASLGDPSLAGGGNTYIDELSARGVLCIQCTPTQPHWNFQKWDPHVWNDRITGSGLLSHVAEMLGKRVGGGLAEWAGDPLFQQSNRRFGLIQYNTVDGAYNGVDTHLAAELGKFKMNIVAKVEYLLDLSRSQEDARVVMAKMKDAGASTVICWCDPLTPIFFTKEATNQQYFPEWVVTGSLLTDSTLFGRLYDQLQWTNAFGVSLLTARVDPEVAASELNVIEWHHGQELSSSPNSLAFGMLFTGVHLAGPNLTPQTFKQGMASLKPSGSYITRPAVSYGLHAWPWFDFHAIDDTTELWWDADEQGPDELGAAGQGIYRYVDMGRRYTLGQRTTTGTPFFDETNTVTVYASRPKGDVLPAYEHKDHHRLP